ncbi:glycosyltransferase family 2 protein [Pseudohalioglobus lutimaris]|uniref:Glycosyl transferase n=1 Tax=Pseudohalioglobus lutimaris TaxID=1737061 RepID=A0A2N5WZM2_9GAMM|nr:glycosyltransferase family 2 protein [Pseudohalioglobus lutimaris]PLW67656.1 glycosyl transferase [Pseudohalioglobus lutimaris]
MIRPCLLIPVYNHPATIGPLVASLDPLRLPVILVNDGSDSACTRVLRELQQRFRQVQLVERERNGGKGAAVKSGLAEAYRLGFSHALQVDADGQHETGDLPTLLELAEQHPRAVISGAPNFSNAPRLRYYGRYLTHIWVWINTLSLDIVDSMCGFRAYPLEQTLAVLNHANTGDRMDFDPEILVRLHWAGVEVIQFQTAVHYPEDGISHFHGLRDNALISWAHTRLFFGMLLRLPYLLRRKWKSRDGN